MGRTEYIRAKEICYRHLENKGLFLPVRKTGYRYLKPTHYDDVVAIGSCVEQPGRASVRFVYEIRSEDKEQLLATGFTQLAAVDKNGKPVRLPQEVKSLLNIHKS